MARRSRSKPVAESAVPIAVPAAVPAAVPVVEPVTITARQKREAEQKALPIMPYIPAPPEETRGSTEINLPRTEINLDEALRWIASCDTPKSCPSLGPAWALVHEQLAKLNVRPNRGALSVLPKVESSARGGGSGLANAIRKAGPDDVPALQTLYAAMRIRYRQAAWHQRRG